LEYLPETRLSQVCTARNESGVSNPWFFDLARALEFIDEYSASVIFAREIEVSDGRWQAIEAPAKPCVSLLRFDLYLRLCESVRRNNKDDDAVIARGSAKECRKIGSEGKLHKSLGGNDPSLQALLRSSIGLDLLQLRHQREPCRNGVVAAFVVPVLLKGIGYSPVDVS
jgi:hypothetical protein